MKHTIAYVLPLVALTIGANAQISDLTFQQKFGDTYTFSAKQFTITATCNSEKSFHGRCAQAGEPGQTYKEDNSETCEGYKHGERRYLLTDTLKFLWVYKVDVKPCGAVFPDVFNIIRISKKETPR